MNVPGLNDRDQRRTIQAVRDLAAGGSNAIGPWFALIPGATETPIEDRACGANTVPVLVPHSAAAGASGWWVKAVEKGRFIVGHTTAGEGALFRYELRQP